MLRFALGECSRPARASLQIPASVSAGLLPSMCANVLFVAWLAWPPRLLLSRSRVPYICAAFPSALRGRDAARSDSPGNAKIGAGIRFINSNEVCRLSLCRAPKPGPNMSTAEDRGLKLGRCETQRVGRKRRFVSE